MDYFVKLFNFRAQTDCTCPKENLGSSTDCFPIEREIHHRRVNFQRSSTVSILSLPCKKTSFIAKPKRRRSLNLNLPLRHFFRRDATATSVPTSLCRSGRRRPENVHCLSSLITFPRLQTTISKQNKFLS